MEVVASRANLQLDVAAVRHAGTVRKGLIEHASQAHAQGRVGQAAPGHIEHGPLVVGGRGRAQHDNVAVIKFIVAVRRLV